MMTDRTSMQAPTSWGTKSRMLMAGLLLAWTMMAASVMASPAHAATTFTVTSTADTGDATPDGSCDSCTLREAIQEANAAAGADIINFHIPGTGVHTISPASPLPAITAGQVTIDGYTQPGAHPNTKTAGNDAVLKVVLNGTNAGSSGFEIIGGSSNNLITGLVINRFTGSAGINIHGTSVGNRVEGNFIGTDPSGTLDRGNEGDGVSVSVGSDEVLIGGTTPASRNVISGNDERGVEIRDASGSLVLGNRIGTTAGGKGALGNGLAGVSVQGSDNGVGSLFVDISPAAGANTIAFNGRDGVTVVGSSSLGNGIGRNSTFSNAGLGIDLGDDGATTNDPGDADAGPNGLQNKPVITSAKSSSTKTTISGKLATAPARGDVLIQFFSNPPGTNEGKQFLGQKVVAPDAAGKASFSYSPSARVPVGRTITATATRFDADATETSEFSAPKTVASS